ncbi:uncharacterized protein LOC131857602 [Cryptomeria japonica]|uniref:uncharacterized protein LOC131857602 n=1 Tax=Cryptomeria japonica TaxID=3369 RepID=UPI0027D9E8DC|nr:uncharacterized protein LOC131857602 [Cryptomeria japonica]
MVLPKARAFLWIVLHEKILMGDRLKVIGIQGPNWCFLCKSEEETSNHLLYKCPFSEACWNWYLDMVGLSLAKNETLKDFLIAWPSSKSSKWSTLWIIRLAMIAWHIWKERNKRIFKEVERSLEAVREGIKIAIEEVVNGKSLSARYVKLTDWDKEMEKKWEFKRIDINQAKKAVDRKAFIGRDPPKGG